MEEKEQDYEIKDLIWKLFEQTGEVSYFMLYNALKDKENED